jgi:hypothetical protein
MSSSTTSKPVAAKATPSSTAPKAVPKSAVPQPVGGGTLANEFVPSYGDHYNPPDDGTDDWDIPQSVLENPLFVSTNSAGGVINALRQLVF